MEPWKGNMHTRQNREWTFDNKTNLMQNGYPENLVGKTINFVRDIAKTTTVEKEAEYSTLPFKGDPVAQLITRRLTKGIEKTYKAARP